MATLYLTFTYSNILTHEPSCYTPADRTFTIPLCLALGWFLVYIYALLGCGLWYKRFRASRKGQQLLQTYDTISQTDAMMVRVFGRGDDAQEAQEIEGNRE